VTYAAGRLSQRVSIDQFLLAERRIMRPTRARFTVGWMAMASIALGEVAADEPKAGEKAAVEQL
jgi:hypothetical protein